jgi:hypothetical protein
MLALNKIPYFDVQGIHDLHWSYSRALTVGCCAGRDSATGTESEIGGGKGTDATDVTDVTDATDATACGENSGK